MSDPRYANLLAVSGRLRAQGSALKAVGVVAVAIGAGVGCWSGAPSGVSVVAVGILVGIGVHATGTLLGAAGEALLALSDIATSVWRSH